MENNVSKNSNQKITFINETSINQFQNDVEENNEIIIELEIKILNEEKEIYILCDKNALIENNKRNIYFYKENKINQPEIFDYFNTIIQNYI